MGGIRIYALFAIGGKPGFRMTSPCPIPLLAGQKALFISYKQAIILFRKLMSNIISNWALRYLLNVIIGTIMKTLLIFPAQWYPTQPYLSTPYLTSYLRAKGWEVDQRDFNIASYDHFLSAPLVAKCRTSDG